ncbi:hypothetical protein [Mycolicibacterium fluoranthenivorans]|uniref:Uncharacterized protein n=1 Tax=Mycolicibacterium fluoranthenivorans TaxID=258505 RepID=A0A7X5TYD3_9MYCO|nr:hypothetical protein [Mycolicibacterium fluoranthenivorans]MCV7358912.1 hypothetical protein [Mycolicibacterium fluoranthenivorans]NIH95028.1 hypothetical protein [Mycolicibacterium fluoranthenivorans]
MRGAGQGASDKYGEPTLVDAVRNSLADGHPLALLQAMGVVVEKGTPYVFSRLTLGESNPLGLSVFVDNLSVATDIEHTMALAVLTELMVDNPALQRRCRVEVEFRGGRLAAWIRDLPRTRVYRAVRIGHALGDRDQLLLDVRMADHQGAVAVMIDHLAFSDVSDLGVTRESFDAAVAHARDLGAPVVEMDLADARAWIEQGVENVIIPRADDSRLGFPAVLRWLLTRLPAGGQLRKSPRDDYRAVSTVFDAFFTSPQGARFTPRDAYEELLSQIVDSGTGDPLRWSEYRARRAMDFLSYDSCGTVDVLIDAPDLLRVFIPIAHALSGIAPALTDRVLAVIDEAEPAFRERVIAEAKKWDD